MSSKNEKDPHKILIIDDEKNIRSTLKKALEAEDYRVYLAENGREGISKAKQKTFDVIMLDLKLPDIKGTKVLEKIREKDIDTPVLVITGYGSVESAVKVMKLGAIDYLEKPFNPAQIKEQVKEIIARKEISTIAEEQEIEAKISEENIEQLIARAKSAINKRNFEAAENLLNKATNFNFEEPAIYNLLGAIEEIRGNHSEAMDRYRTALNMDPSYKPAQKNLDRAKELGRGPEGISLEDQEKQE